MRNVALSNDPIRRDFQKGASVGTMMAVMGGVELQAQPSVDADMSLTGVPVPDTTVNYGIIGVGPQGREIIAELSKIPHAPVVALCDKYPAALRRAGDAAPKAKRFEDYRKLLDCEEIQAVVVATSTHQHKEIVLAALKAGKHVYCEAPLAHTTGDAREIAVAAKASIKTVFQTGLQDRCHPHRKFVIPLIREGTAGQLAEARAQYHNKKSWAASSPDANREKEINWRLRKEVSTGLIGEIGIHQLDMISLLAQRRPIAVTGFGSSLEWNDGRDVPDSVHAVIEYTGGFNLSFDATLANSFDSAYELIHGDLATLMMRGTHAWLFTEADSPAFGWEVYAEKETYFGQTGIALYEEPPVIVRRGKNPWENDPYQQRPLYFALETFTQNVRLVGASVQLQTGVFPGWKEGFEATVVAIKANEAIMNKERIVLKDEWFEV